MKKITKLLLSAVIGLGISAVSGTVCFAEEDVDWMNLYSEKINEIKNDYKNGLISNSNTDTWHEGALYFSLQDINFDGVPELYYTSCNHFEGEFGTSREYEKIYYIKDGNVLQGKIQSEYNNIGLLPMYHGKKAQNGDLSAQRWQFVMKDKSTGEICFITNDSCNYGALDYPRITYLKLNFDIDTGVLSTECLLYLDADSYTEPQSLEGYEYIGADMYFDNSPDETWDLTNWKSAYVAPKIVLNGQRLTFNRPPVIKDGRTLVPIRKIAVSLNASVEYIPGNTSEVVISKNGKDIVLTIGSNDYLADGEKKTMDVPAQIMSGRTFVPARVLSECLSCRVEWDESTQTVNIQSQI